MKRSRFGLVSTIAAACCCLLGIAGCTSGSAGVNLQTLPTSSSPSPSSAALSTVPDSTADSTTSNLPPVRTSATTAAPTSSSTPATASSTTAHATDTAAPATTKVDPALQEIADRAAIEAVWTKYWEITKELAKVPVAQRADVVNAVAVPSQTAGVLAATAKEEAAGQAEYGQAVHRPYWSAPVAGNSTAVMGDCMNDYNAGTLDVKTGKHLIAGIERDNTRITFVKGADGAWRVSKVEYLVNIPC